MASAVAGAMAENIKGTVRTTEGEPLAGVVVSDGLNTVQTDSKGRFEMDTDKDSRFVFISTPSGYISATLKGETLFYKEIKKKVKSYDFVVKKNPIDDRKHNLIVIADPQISDRTELPELDKYADDIYLYQAPEKVYTYQDVLANQPNDGVEDVGGAEAEHNDGVEDVGGAEPEPQPEPQP